MCKLFFTALIVVLLPACTSIPEGVKPERLNVLHNRLKNHITKSFPQEDFNLTTKSKWIINNK